MTLSRSDLPPASRFVEPILRILGAAGGSLTIGELDSRVAQNLGLSEELLRVLHDPAKGRTEFAYRMAWARTRLKAKGLLQRVGASRWALAGSER